MHLFAHWAIAIAIEYKTHCHKDVEPFTRTIPRRRHKYWPQRLSLPPLSAKLISTSEFEALSISTSDADPDNDNHVVVTHAPRE